MVPDYVLLEQAYDAVTGDEPKRIPLFDIHEIDYVSKCGSITRELITENHIKRQQEEEAKTKAS